MAKQKQHDQLDHTYSSYVKIRDVGLETCQRRWMIGRSGERGSGISVLAARHDEKKDDDMVSYRLIDLVGRVFANSSGDLGSIPGRVVPKTLKMVLDTTLLNTQQFKVRIEAKVEPSRERSSAPLHLGVVAIEKGAFWSPSATVANFTFYMVSSNL